jgi:hypothetical protein
MRELYANSYRIISIEDAKKEVAKISAYLKGIEKPGKRLFQTAAKTDELEIITIDGKGGAIKNLPLKKVTINIKGAETIRNFVQSLENLNDKNRYLVNLKGQISITFKGDKGIKDVLASIDALQLSLAKKQATIGDQIEELAKNNVPQQFVRTVAAVINYLKPKASKFKDRLLIDIDDKNVVRFTNYIGLENVKNSQGFAYKAYFVVLSYVIDPKLGMSQFITTMSQFKTPGTFKMGVEFKNPKQATDNLDIMLDNDSMISLIDKSKLPTLKPSSVSSLSDYIHAVKFKQNEVIIELNEDVVASNIDSVSNHIVAEFFKLANKDISRAKNTHGIGFKITGDPGEYDLILNVTLPQHDTRFKKQFNEEKMKGLQQDLKLSPAQTNKLRQIFDGI